MKSVNRPVLEDSRTCKKRNQLLLLLCVLLIRFLSLRNFQACTQPEGQRILNRKNKNLTGQRNKEKCKIYKDRSLNSDLIIWISQIWIPHSKHSKALWITAKMWATITPKKMRKKAPRLKLNQKWEISTDRRQIELGKHILGLRGCVLNE